MGARNRSAIRERREPGLGSGTAVQLDLMGQEIRGFTARESIYERSSFANAVLTGLRLRDVRLEGCDLSNATALGFEAIRVEFIQCRLTGLKAMECRWQDVLVEDCDLKYAQFNDARFEICEFRSSACQESDFRGADVSGLRLSRVLLEKADFTGAALSGLDLRSCGIDGLVVRPDDVAGAIVSPPQALELARLLGVVIQ